MSERRAVRHEERRAGSAIWFRVRDHDGRAGSSWKVSTSANSSDVVLTHREGGRWVHATFHDSEWHFAISNAGQALHPEVPPFPLTMPSREPPPGGMVVAARLLLPLIVTAASR